MPKVTIELESEQIDAIIVSELKARILDIYERGKRYIHPDDEEQDRILAPALFIVHEHYAGAEASNKLRDEICDASRML